MNQAIVAAKAQPIALSRLETDPSISSIEGELHWLERVAQLIVPSWRTGVTTKQNAKTKDSYYEDKKHREHKVKR